MIIIITYGDAKCGMWRWKLCKQQSDIYWLFFFVAVSIIIRTLSWKNVLKSYNPYAQNVFLKTSKFLLLNLKSILLGKNKWIHLTSLTEHPIKNHRFKHSWAGRGVGDQSNVLISYIRQLSSAVLNHQSRWYSW